MPITLNGTTGITTPGLTNAGSSIPAAGTNGNVLTSDGTNWTSATPSAAYAGLNSQLFTASGTFTVPTSITKVKVTVFGGGGGACITQGAPGGLGGVAIGYYTVTSGASITVTIGAGGASASGAGSSGGTTSFGAFISATGGAGKANSSARPTNGSGSSGTLMNFKWGTNRNLSPDILASFGTFTGLTARLVTSGANSFAAVAYSATLTGGYAANLSDTSAVLPGAAGGVNDFSCITYAAGAVNGIVLVEW